MKKILVITPKFPIPTTGACEQERLAGLSQLKRLGYEIRVIAKVFDWQDKTVIERWCVEHDIKLDLLPYSFFAKSWCRKLKKLANPKCWDGAAAEYFVPDIQGRVKEVVSSWQPDIAWFDYTYLWPLYKNFKQKNIPVVTRSINFEPVHFLQEDGFSFKNLLKFLPKVLSEVITVKKSDIIFAITPKEEKIYKMLGAKRAATLPLRSLPDVLQSNREIANREVLHLFFIGASYNVQHNRKAAELLIKNVAPEVERRAPGRFVFHILGKKLPPELAKLCVGNIIEEGFVDNLNDFLDTMDIAVIPSLMGAGMQQKIFEPLARGIPSVISPRGLAGYPFKDGEHALFAAGQDEFTEQILKLLDVNLRRHLSKNALRLSGELFARERLDTIVQQAVCNII